MYESIILLTFVKSSFDRSIWSIVFCVTIQFILRISRLVQSHVNEKTKNKNIQQEVETLNITRQEVEVCIQKLSIDLLILFIIFKFSIRISFDREWFTSHDFWEIEINEFAITSNARLFFAQFWQMQFQKQ